MYFTILPLPLNNRVDQTIEQILDDWRLELADKTLCRDILSWTKQNDIISLINVYIILHMVTM